MLPTADPCAVGSRAAPCSTLVPERRNLSSSTPQVAVVFCEAIALRVVPGYPVQYSRPWISTSSKIEQVLDKLTEGRPWMSCLVLGYQNGTVEERGFTTASRDSIGLMLSCESSDPGLDLPVFGAVLPLWYVLLDDGPNVFLAFI